MDDRWIEGSLQEYGECRTDNCVVLYDLVGGLVITWGYHGFSDDDPKDGWWCGATFDPDRNLLFLADARSSQADGVYEREFEIDLIAGRIRRCVRDKKIESARLKVLGGAAVNWDWSDGGGQQPEWGVPGALPKLLRMEAVGPVSEDVRRELDRIGIAGNERVFEWDEASGGYRVCGTERWGK